MKKKTKKPVGPWLSVTQYAEKYGYGRSTVRNWLNQLERDTRITLEQRIAIFHGPKYARRIHEQRFAVWLALPKMNAREKPITFLYTTPVMQ